jgi:hypothetical protein
LTQKFEHRHLLSANDWDLLGNIIGNPLRYPDLVIAPDGVPYLYRWHVFPQNPAAGVYFHIQVQSDPERPLHDHPWDNTSVILSGGYNELWCSDPEIAQHGELRQQDYPMRSLHAGETVFRKAEEAHRLILPPEFTHTMTLFTCGAKRREWGFWYPDGWRPFTDVTRTEDGRSVHIKKRGS